ncbi:AAA family ATPase [Streptococcus equinus]|uniref:AAA family ATPase n=1 Tax=Streptococcus equinus TaxID=1335 RepID=UPI0008E7CBE1|nr:ATP-binding protein [Streptococcus equinus]SFQ58914.1 hypothetical protein SAMN05216422_0384 [Streptococcus equinus]
MFIEFQVENFLSISELSVLSMETGKYLRKYSNTHVLKKSNTSLLKNINIFGANGSGKSNLLSALKVFTDLVLKPTKDIETKLPYMPFKLDQDSEKKGTTFSVKFIKNETIYLYTVKYNSDEIMLEELSKLTSSESKEVYFRRTNQTGEDIIPDHLLELLKTVRKNKLLLFEGQDKNDAICTSVFQWFHSSLIFETSAGSKNNLFKLIQEDEAKKQIFIKLLNLADFNIVDVDIIEKTEVVTDEMKKFFAAVLSSGDAPLPKQVTTLEVYSKYKKYDSTGKLIGYERIPYDMESAGTKKMMLVSLTILNSLHKDRVIIMDEFDDSFHLSLTKSLLELINSSVNDNQFIFTTHNLNLLDSNLRVDQIYLTEKDFLGRTELFSLFDFNGINGVARSDISFAKRYLNGQFGALPDIDIEGMKNLFKEI